ncbi:hypothetical protein [Ornithinibacillus sp. 179-J 7C1 HS]|uniref:hypothetical protein n=1 Tax=Ornithinibacillus sp. 179-J 7C1 HS TaxID=3142384 RepID=UPI00399F60F2
MKKLLKWKIEIILVFLILIGNGIASIFAEKIAIKVERQTVELHVTGVVDRVEDGEIAVIIVEELQLELYVHVTEFEVDIKPNLWVNITLSEGNIKDISVNLSKTMEEKENMKKLLELIKQ